MTVEYRNTPLSPDLKIGCVQLSVANLDRSVEFYTRNLGLKLMTRESSRAVLGAGNSVLLWLEELPGAQRFPHTTGLYHFALLLPSRLELAKILQHLIHLESRFVGFADHAVSEALYLEDPDGHGIELYRDRPRSDWFDSQGNFRMTTDPLDVQGLLAQLPDAPDFWQEIHPDTVMGHVHLHVADLQAAKAFYVDALGFDLMADWHSAAFLSVGGYHHHLGMNTWAGVNAPPPPAQSLHLLSYEIILPHVADLLHLRDHLDSRRISYGGANTSGTIRLEDPSQNTLIIRSD